MAEDSDLEKTEPASSRRLQQAREEGQVPRSREVGAFLTLLVAAAAFWSIGGWLMRQLSAVVRHGLTFERTQLNDNDFILYRLASLSWDALVSVMPLMLVLAVTILLSPMFMGSWNFSTKALVPDLMRMNPLKGIARLFAWSSLVELFKSLGKASLVGGVAAWVLWLERGEIISLSVIAPEAGLSKAGELINFSFLLMVLSMVLIVAIDVPFQLWQYHHRLRMTKEEVRQEGKELEGNPEVKGRIRRLQREAARRRMMAAVPEADVIVTNPTHFSVALSYKNGMSAPKLLAKGTDNLALKIREIGAEHGIPMLEAPPLARSLYRHVELDEEVPAPLYAAVAEVLAYIYQLNKWKKIGGQYPAPPAKITVPPEMVVDF